MQSVGHRVKRTEPLCAKFNNFGVEFTSQSEGGRLILPKTAAGLGLGAFFW